MTPLPLRHDIAVSVRVVYAGEHSKPGQHVFVYFITITNRSGETVQLLERAWVIRQASGAVTEVRGEGVVGEQPVLEPGDRYEYNSFCPIETPPGSMEGFYTFQNLLGARFKVEIPAFALRLPGERSLN
jgi:ApaG protein